MVFELSDLLRIEDDAELARRVKARKVHASLSETFSDWLHTPAGDVDINDDHQLLQARLVGRTLEALHRRYGWRAASANNVISSLSDHPLKVILVPDPQDESYITLANARIVSAEGTILSAEMCGSLDDIYYIVPRHAAVEVEGYVLGGGGAERTRLRYGYEPSFASSGERYFPGQEPVFNIQHEINHTEGVILPYIGIPLDDPTLPLPREREGILDGELIRSLAAKVGEMHHVHQIEREGMHPLSTFVAPAVQARY